MTQQAWFDGTSLDFSLLDPSWVSGISSLADSTYTFYNKYVLSRNSTLLQNDLNNVLQCGLEYAGELGSSIQSYFDQVYPNSQNTNPFSPPTNPTNSLLTPSSDSDEFQTNNASPNLNPYLSPNNPYGGNVSNSLSQLSPSFQPQPNPPNFSPFEGLDLYLTKTEGNATLAEQKQQILQTVASQLLDQERKLTSLISQSQSSNPTTSAEVQYIQQSVSSVNAEVSSLKSDITINKQEIAHLQDTIKRLADSFNQLRQFVEDLDNKVKQSASSPISISQPSSPMASSQYGQPQQPMQNSYNPYQPGGYSPPIQPPPNRGSPYGSINPYGGHGNNNNMASNFPFSDVLNQSPLIPTDPQNTKIINHTAAFMALKESRVWIDYIILDSCIACTWKIHNLPYASILRFGFMMDSGLDEQRARDLEVSLCTNGQIWVPKKQIEGCETIVEGDVIRLELNLAEHYAVFFRNERMLPYRILDIPEVLKFYIVGYGQGVRAECTSLVTIPAITEPAQRLMGIKELRYRK